MKTERLKLKYAFTYTMFRKYTFHFRPLYDPYVACNWWYYKAAYIYVLLIAMHKLRYETKNLSEESEIKCSGSKAEITSNYCNKC